MGFIRDALIGVALYETVRYFFRKQEVEKFQYDLSVGSDPNANFTGQGYEMNDNDPWKNSLADNELRAPDS